MEVIMLKKITCYFQLTIVAIIFSVNVINGQTVGLLLNDTTNTFKGYTLFAPKHNTMTYLIDNEGRKVHGWSASIYAPGQSVYLLENGNLLRTCQVQSSLGTGGGEGGRIEEYNWNDSLVWFLNYSTSTYMQHHDIKRLPNGNIIMCIVEKKTIADAISAGFDTSKFQPDVRQHGFFLPDAVVEIQPTYPSGGTVVWEWHVFDHLIQNFDATKLNYGTPSQHPELIDAAGDHLMEPLFWNHVNSIDYNSDLDQIALSVRGNSEVWVIDHSTTTALSAGHTGGVHNKGGDLLYRWGNPICYGAGTTANAKYYQQHDAEWIKTGCPGAGHIMCFNNGLGRNYSSIDEIAPPIDINGNYLMTAGQPYGPSNLYWTYQASPQSSLFAHDISGVQRLPNGNTLIDDGPHGTFMEVTSSGNMVWKYICPVDNNGPLIQGDTAITDPTHADEYMNAVFRVYRYPLTYSAFTGRDMTSGNFIELYPSSINNELLPTPNIKNYPNPFMEETVIEFNLIKSENINLSIFNENGQLVRRLIAGSNLSEGKFQVNWDGKNEYGVSLPGGIYWYAIQGESGTSTKGKIVLVK